MKRKYEAKRPQLSMFSVDKNFNDVVKSLDEGKIFVCQFEQGTCVFVDKEFNLIMANPHTEETTSANLVNRDNFSKMFNEVFMLDPEYEFFTMETDGHSINELFVGATEALMCLKTGDKYGGYRLRKMN